ncbi:MAG: AmmeMemoRadiSam system radical SAM enzyme [candidate division WOR-3 bacterium]|nr:MAG: AmmeMemoRadiSam system radical SAM enzyme [candidate division WOR-3 bacterium]
MNHAARFWRKVKDGVRCELCPNFCMIGPGDAGRCLGRRNVGGELVAFTYGETVSMGSDPIEKKPLYHFHPGTSILSVATYGCNLACPFCQNCEISQEVAPTRYVAPEHLVTMALESGGLGVAFTYTEPMVWFEYLMDAGRMLKEHGQMVVLVTNGMINAEPLEELLPLVDAMNVDLKSIRPSFYRDYVRGRLGAVLNTVERARRSCHLELTTLLIPGRNDSEEEIEELVDFVAGLGPSTVLHFSRYFPRHRAKEPPTPVAGLVAAAEIARRKLDYVYLGNVVVDQYRDTLCPQCGSLLVERSGYTGVVRGISGGKCTNCGRISEVVT